MLMRRIVRRWLSGLLVLTILFTQVATAAYACPAYSGSNEAPVSAMPCANMMGAGMALDPDQPGLCQQHCQFGNTQQAGDPLQAFALPGVNLAILFGMSPTRDADVASAVQQPLRERAPPHSILHCCYRF